MVWTVIAYCTLAGPTDSVGMDSVFVRCTMVDALQPASEISALSGSGMGNSLVLKSSLPARQYGATGVATFAVRGTAAHQNQVLWNGVNINNALLGQVDLNQVAVSSMASVHVNESSNASLIGSGAVGGTLYINNSLLFENFKQLELGAEVGNYGMKTGTIMASLGSKRYFLGLNGRLGQYQNNYRIAALDNSRLTNASSEYKAMDAVVGFKLKYGLLKWAGQYVNTDRNLPNYATNTWAGGLQNQSLRNVIEYINQTKKRMHSILVSAVKDKYNYSDFTMPQYKGTRSVSYTARYNFNYTLAKQWYLQSMLEGALDVGTVYNEMRELKRGALAAAVYYKPNKHILGLQQRWDAVANKYIYKGLYEYNAGNKRYYLTVGNTFRNATLNELYWATDVKRELLPEMGNVAEIGTRVMRKLVTWNALIYARAMRNEIMWVPNNGTSIPINIGKNKVIGIDFMGTIQWNWRAAKFNSINNVKLWNAYYDGNTKAVLNSLVYNSLTATAHNKWVTIVSKFQNSALPYMAAVNVPFYYSLDACIGWQVKNFNTIIGINNITNRVNYLIGNQQLVRRNILIEIKYTLKK